MLQQPRILYLEDTPDEIAPHLLAIQQTFQAEVILATSYEQAVKALDGTPFDLFILDIEMGNSRAGGIQLAEQLRQFLLYRQTPILFTSMHTHHSHRLLSTIRHSAFLSKPLSLETLVQQVGVALGDAAYTSAWYRPTSLFLETSRGMQIELTPQSLSFIELRRRTVHVQYIDGNTLDLEGEPGIFKNLLGQVENGNISCLRQVYRSLLINVNQIRAVKLRGNAGDLWLFGDEEPKPIGIQYRKNIKEFF